VILNVQLGSDSADVSDFNATSQFSKKALLYVEDASILRSFSYTALTATYNTIYLCVSLRVVGRRTYLQTRV
jgi:hypothetical protein